MLFKELNLSPSILKAVAKKGYDTPTPIQQQAIPAVLDKHDLLAAAQTGTGKTAGFVLPILHNLSESKQVVKSNNVRALVLTPTRELAAQIYENAELYSQYLDTRSNVVFGGVKINPQMQKLRRGSDILVATPGRLLDLHNQNAIKFSQLEVLVLDEADRMLDMGFIRDIQKIIRLLPKQRQNLMFSATFSDDIRTLAKTIVNNPVEVSVTPENTTAQRITQWVVPVEKSRKAALLPAFIQEQNWHQVLVFSKTKHGANKLAKKLEAQGLDASAIHGNKSQAARTRALADFKSGDIQVLVATDIAARGLDISELPHVINYDMPNVAADYVHRIGRTGRAGKSGEAVSFVCDEDADLLREVQNLIGQIIERKPIAGYEPSEPLPDFELNSKPRKIKKPKKPKQNTRPENNARSENGKPAPRRRSRRRSPNKSSTAPKKD